MRVVTLSPAKEGSPWNHRVASMRTECQMRCGKKSVRFSLITRPVCVEADHGEIYDPSRMQFSTDYVQVAKGKRFLRVLLQAVRHTPISRNGCNWASSQGLFRRSCLGYTMENQTVENTAKRTFRGYCIATRFDRSYVVQIPIYRPRAWNQGTHRTHGSKR